MFQEFYNMFGCNRLDLDSRIGKFLPISSIPILLGLTGFLLTSCAVTPENRSEQQTVIVEETHTLEAVTIEEEPEPIVRGLEQDQPIIVLEDPWELVEQANQAVSYEAPGLLIRAINAFLQRGQVNTAQTVSRQLGSYPLSPTEQFSFNLIRARIANHTDRPGVALNILDALNPDQPGDTDTRSQILKIKSEAQIALGRTSDAVASLLDLDPLLMGHDQIQNQQKVLRLLQSINPLERALLKENYINPDLSGWVAIADLLNEATSDYIQIDVQSWRNIYPRHPLLGETLNALTESAQMRQYRQIAILLPFTSTYGKAAKAFYDGFIDAHSWDPSLQRPEVILYDIGEEIELSALYHQAAINDGADLIVGPLGRQATESLLSGLVSETDTLVISDIPEGHESKNLYGISLSPEDEARQVAEKAYADGHRQAAIFRINTPWGQRVATAFMDHWEALGGITVSNRSFPGTISDYTKIIQKYFGLDKSIARHRLLKAQSGVNLKFTPRRNDDMDFLFLAANSEQARLVVPQLRFFQAHNLPIYSTSYVYSGKPDPGNDADLNGLIFGEMKWMLDGVDRYRQKLAEQTAQKAELKAAETAARLAEEERGLTNETETTEQDPVAALDTEPDNTRQTDKKPQTLPENEKPIDAESMETSLVQNQNNDGSDLEIAPPASFGRPYQGTALDRLYALGRQSYQLTSRLSSLRENQWRRFIGDAMTVSVDQNGTVVQHPIWTQFKAGLPRPLGDTTN